MDPPWTSSLTASTQTPTMMRMRMVVLHGVARVPRGRFHKMILILEILLNPHQGTFDEVRLSFEDCGF